MAELTRERISAMPRREARWYLPYDQWPAVDPAALGADHCTATCLRRCRRALAWPTPRNASIGWHGGGGSGSWRSTNPPYWRALQAERLTVGAVRSFAAHLAETNTPRSVAIQVDAVYKAAQGNDAGTRLGGTGSRPSKRGCIGRRPRLLQPGPSLPVSTT